MPDILGNDQSILPVVQAARLVVSHEGALFRVGMPDRKLLQYVKVSARSRRNCDHKLRQSQHLGTMGKDWKNGTKGQTRILDIETVKWDAKACERMTLKKKQLTAEERKARVRARSLLPHATSRRSKHELWIAGSFSKEKEYKWGALQNCQQEERCHKNW